MQGEQIDFNRKLIKVASQRLATPNQKVPLLRFAPDFMLIQSCRHKSTRNYGLTLALVRQV